jgi:hypothetical protein
LDTPNKKPSHPRRHESSVSVQISCNQTYPPIPCNYRADSWLLIVLWFCRDVQIYWELYQWALGVTTRIRRMALDGRTRGSHYNIAIGRLGSRVPNHRTLVWMYERMCQNTRHQRNTIILQYILTNKTYMNENKLKETNIHETAC